MLIWEILCAWNHDYGEYVPWENEEAHSRNMNKLFSIEENAGFTLLKNESVVITKVPIVLAYAE
jgi:hypothetical protein